MKYYVRAYDFGEPNNPQVNFKTNWMLEAIKMAEYLLDADRCQEIRIIKEPEENSNENH